jgi:uncharacterized protein YoxC
MKRLKREINIFSMSALDLFASAMGSFILLTVILFPYYLKNADIVERMSALRQQLEKTQQQLQTCSNERQQCQQQLQTCSNERQQCQQQRAQLQQDLQNCQAQKGNLQGEINSLKQDLKNCQQKLRQTFLAVVMKWETQKQDVDLHVIDPNNNEFYYQKHNRNHAHFPNANAELSVDTTKGPGIEIWENPLAKQGIYKIYANLYARKGNTENPVVKTTIYYRDGSKKLPNITLIEKANKKLIATIEVNAEGDVVVR